MSTKNILSQPSKDILRLFLARGLHLGLQLLHRTQTIQPRSYSINLLKLGRKLLRTLPVTKN